MNAQIAMNQYKSVGLKSVIESAGSHQLIEMLLKGAATKVREAKLAMSGGEIALKGETISKVIAILEYLRASLDPGIDAKFAEQLGELYQYMERQLLKANLRNDESILDEILGLLNELSEGWSGIPNEYRN